ncbi:hypothetical protein [Brevundimonas pishanensis]|uniref:hypothetical protein n=1 Tax=Brevundimonas pishanensis TaxID=2896315 RepID=UPI001FA76787|nr:hypothetical protein [Brevundimonas pishanensis]
MNRPKIIADPALYGVPATPVRVLPRRVNRPRPWLLLAPGIAMAIAAAWLDGYIERPLLLALMVPSAILIAPIYSHRISLYLVYACVFGAYAYAIHLFGICC